MEIKAKATENILFITDELDEEQDLEVTILADRNKTNAQDLSVWISKENAVKLLQHLVTILTK